MRALTSRFISSAGGWGWPGAVFRYTTSLRCGGLTGSARPGRNSASRKQTRITRIRANMAQASGSIASFPPDHLACPKFKSPRSGETGASDAAEREVDPGLERVSQSHLQHSRIRGGRKIAESAWARQRQTDVSEVDKVERIERLNPQLQAVMFPRQREALRHRKIDVLLPRHPDNGTRARPAGVRVHIVGGHLGAGENTGIAILVK